MIWNSGGLEIVDSLLLMDESTISRFHCISGESMTVRKMKLHILNYINNYAATHHWNQAVKHLHLAVWSNKSAHKKVNWFKMFPVTSFLQKKCFCGYKHNFSLIGDRLRFHGKNPKHVVLHYFRGNLSTT